MLRLSIDNTCEIVYNAVYYKPIHRRFATVESILVCQCCCVYFRFFVRGGGGGGWALWLRDYDIVPPKEFWFVYLFWCYLFEPQK